MSDRVTEAYYGQRGSEQDSMLARERVNWMCRRVIGPQVLDVGCSQGIATILLARDGNFVTGIDVDEKALTFARTELAKETPGVQARASFLHCAIGDAELEKAGFDTILLGEVVEHLAAPHQLLEQTLRFLRKGGRLIATTPFGVHRDPDHKQTFYAHSFLELVGRYCAPEELFLTSHYMHFCGVLREQPLDRTSAEQIFAEYGHARLVADEATAFQAKEDRYLQAQDSLKARREKLTLDLEALRGRIREHQGTIKDLKKQLRDAKLANEILAKRLSGWVGGLSRMDRGVRKYASRIRKQLLLPAAKAPNGNGAKKPLATATSSRPCVVFVPTNGAGLGHLTRSLAVASRVEKLVPGVRIVFHSTSMATREIEQLGYAAYYMPPRDLRPEQTPQIWNELFARSLNDVFESHGASLIVFDGVSVYAGLRQALTKHRLPAIWINRGSWRDTGAYLETLDKFHEQFDRILIPGEVTPTPPAFLGSLSNAVKGKVEALAPFVYLGTEALLPREVSLQHLRLPEDRAHVLVQLGAGNINDLDSVLAVTLTELRQRFPEAQISVARSPIAERAPQVTANTHVIQEYPLARYLKAFDLIVTAAGYNSVHESLFYGIPTIIVPNPDTRTDDQIERATRAAAGPLIEAVHPFSKETMRAALTTLFGSGELDTYRSRWQPTLDVNGAAQGAEVVARLLKQKAQLKGAKRDWRDQVFGGAQPQN